MSKYTITMYEQYGTSYSYSDIANDLFSGLAYTFVNDEMKKEIENDFVKHFYLREIGLETFDLFKFYLRNHWLHVCQKYELLFLEEMRLTSNSTEALFGSSRTETYSQTRNIDRKNDRKNSFDSNSESSSEVTTNENATTRIDNTPQTPYIPGNYANNMTFVNADNLTDTKSNQTIVGNDNDTDEMTETLSDSFTRTVAGNDVSTQNFELITRFAQNYKPLIENMMEQFNFLFLQIW